MLLWIISVLLMLNVHGDIRIVLNCAIQPHSSNAADALCQQGHTSAIAPWKYPFLSMEVPFTG